MANYTVAPSEPKDLTRMSTLESCRHYHADLIRDLGISQADFQIKSPFYDNYGRYVVGIFPSEFNREKGIFFEFVDKVTHEPLDSKRTVYRVPPSNVYNEEYSISPKGAYMIPVDELRVVNPQSVAISKSLAVTSGDAVFSSKEPKTKEHKQVVTPPSEDAPFSEMTIRDFYAIHTGKLVSSKSWLNQLIKTNS